MTPDRFDPATLGNPVCADRLTALAGARSRLPAPAKGEQYLGGPVPMNWLERAAALPGKAFHLGVALWFAAVRSRGKSPAVPLTEALARRFGCGARTTRSRALAALASAGLVSVEVRTGRAPVVTILPAPNNGEPVGGDE